MQPNLDEIRRCYSLFYGAEVTRRQIADLGWQCLEDEWEFNQRAGFTEADDDMAACLREEGIGPDHAFVFDIPPEVCIQAKIKPPLRDSLFEQGAAA